MLGARIASLRKKAGLSQAELATHLHVSASAVGMYEQGRRVPNSAMLIALADEFDVSIDYLLTGECNTKNDVYSSANYLIESLLDPRARETLASILAAALIGK